MILDMISYFIYGLFGFILLVVFFAVVYTILKFIKSENILEDMAIGALDLGAPRDRIDFDFDFDFGEDNQVIHIDIINGEPEPNPSIKGTDVHDHTVQVSLKTSFDRLKASSLASTDSLTCIKEIKKEIFMYKDLDISEKAYSTLRIMEKYNGKLSSINTTELAVLSMVWNRICHPINSHIRQDLINSLILQLADASMTLDMSRCLSGRIARIIQSLEGIDAEGVVNIASTEAIKQELSDKIPNLMRLNKSKSQSQSTCKLRELIDTELRKEYIDTGLLTLEEYSRISKDYIMAIEADTETETESLQ